MMVWVAISLPCRYSACTAAGTVSAGEGRAHPASLGGGDVQPGAYAALHEVPEMDTLLRKSALHVDGPAWV